MFTLDRDTATIVAVLMCIIATVYMYKELNKTKSEMENVKGFYGNLMAHLSRPDPEELYEETDTKQVCEIHPKKESVSITQVENSEEDSSE
jgi:hypothetical protein